MCQPSLEQGCTQAVKGRAVSLSLLLVPRKGGKCVKLVFAVQQESEQVPPPAVQGPLSFHYTVVSALLISEQDMLQCWHTPTIRQQSTAYKSFDSIKSTRTNLHCIRKHAHRKLHRPVSAKTNTRTAQSHLLNDKGKDWDRISDSVITPKGYTALHSYVSVIKPQITFPQSSVSVSQCILNKQKFSSRSGHLLHWYLLLDLLTFNCILFAPEIQLKSKSTTSIQIRGGMKIFADQIWAQGK